MSVSRATLYVCVWNTSLCLCASSLPSMCCPSARKTSKVAETTTAALTPLMTDSQQNINCGMSFGVYLIYKLCCVFNILCISLSHLTKLRVAFNGHAVGHV